MTSAAPPATALERRTVLVRADFSRGVSAELGDTVRAILDAGGRAAVIAGLGAPGGEVNPALSLRRFCQPLASACGVPVAFVGESVGIGAEAGLSRVPFGAAAILENLRFHSDVRRAARVFAVRLSALADFFVVTGSLPARPASWIGELQALLPEPPIALRKSERETA